MFNIMLEKVFKATTTKIPQRDTELIILIQQTDLDRAEDLFK